MQLKKNRAYLNQADAIVLYKHAIVPILEYGNFIVDSGPQTGIRRLQTQQNNGLRICTRSKVIDISINQLHKTCKVARLETRRKKQLACLMYRHTTNPENCVIQRNRTRSDKKVKMKVERPHREKYRKGPLYRGMLIWDELDCYIQDAETVDQFKTKIASIIK